jgi:hypothetical protein
MNQGAFWEADCYLAGQEILHHVWKPKVMYHVQKSPSVEPPQNQLNPGIISATNLIRIHFNLIFPFLPRRCLKHILKFSVFFLCSRVYLNWKCLNNYVVISLLVWTVGIYIIKCSIALACSMKELWNVNKFCSMCTAYKLISSVQIRTWFIQ